METLKVKWTGIRPLIMENVAMIDPFNPTVKALRKLNGHYKSQVKQVDNDAQSEETLREMDRLKWLASAYWDDTTGLYIPGDNVARCIRDGASATKKGKKADAAVVVEEQKVSVLGIDRRKSLLDYYAEGSGYVLRCAIRIPPKTGCRVMANKVMIPVGWRLEFTLSYNRKMISAESLKEAMMEAGSSKGIGGWRPKYGRFTSEVA